MKIAFTTSDRVHVNAHFGWAREIEVYEVSEQGYEFVETLKFEGELKEDGNEDKITPKLQSIHDCTIVYVTAIGGTAAAKLIKKGVTPVKVKSEDEKIAEILTKLVQTLKGNPPPWLRKALQTKKPSFIEEIENEATV
jgi:nitrogen fixation protein NifX